MNDAAKPKIRKPKLVHPHKQVGYLQTEIRAWAQESYSKMYKELDKMYESTQELFRYGVPWNAKVFCLDRNLNASPASISRALKTLEVRGLILVKRRTTTEKRITHIKIRLTPAEQRIEDQRLNHKSAFQKLAELQQRK
jgi:hypothetical protein